MLVASEPVKPVTLENTMMEEETLVVTEAVPFHSLLGLLTPVPIASVPSHMHSTPPPLLPQLSPLPPLLLQPASPVPQSPSLSPCQGDDSIISSLDLPIYCPEWTKVIPTRISQIKLQPHGSNQEVSRHEFVFEWALGMYGQ